MDYTILQQNTEIIADTIEIVAFTVQCCLKNTVALPVFWDAGVVILLCHQDTISTPMNSLPKKANLHCDAVVRVVIHRGERLWFIVLPGLARAHPVLRFGGWEGEVLSWVCLSGDWICLWTRWRGLLLLDKQGKDIRLSCQSLNTLSISFYCFIIG